MKTFLPQNKFYSDVHETSGSAAATLSPPSTAAAVVLSDSRRLSLADGTPELEAGSTCGSTLGLPDSLETEAAVFVRTAAVSDNFIGHLIHHARLVGLPAFVPDYEAMEAAMHNPSAPRALEGDPVWEDEPPLFLRNSA